MNNRTTLALLVLFFAGLGLLWWGGEGRDAAVDPRLLSELVLPALIDRRPAEVARVVIEGPDGEIDIRRRGDGPWQLARPLDVAADRSALEVFLRDVGTLRRLPGSGTVEGSPGRYGLEPPRRVVRLYGDGDHPLATLELGLKSGNRRYVRAGAGGPISVVEDRLVAAAELPASQWREATLFAGPSFQVEGVSVAGPGRDLELERDRGRWRLVRPFRAPVDEAKAEGVVADLLSLRVADPTGFVADGVADFAPYGLDEPRLTLTVAGPGGDQVVAVGEAAPEGDEGGGSEFSYARRLDQDDVVLVRNAALRELGASPEPLLGTAASDLDPSAVAAIRLEEGGRTHDLLRRAGGWEQVGPDAGPVDDPAIVALVRALAGLTSPERLEPGRAADARLDPPSAVLRVWEAPGPLGTIPDSPPDLALEIGRRDAALKVVYARFPGDDKVLTLPEAFGDALPRGPLAFRDRRLFRDDPARVARLRIARPDDAFRVERVDTPGRPPSWKLTAPVEAPADPEALGLIAHVLAGLRAERFLADEPGPAARLGPGQAVYEITWSLDAPSGDSEAGPDRTLRIGAEVPGRPRHRFARLSDRPAAFILGPEASEAFDVELRDRQAVSFRPGRATRIELAWPDRALAFDRVAPPVGGPPEWRLAPGLDATGFEPARLNPMLAELSGLQTPRYVQYRGAFDRSLGLSPPLLTVRVTLAGEDAPKVLRVGTPVTEGPYAGHYLATAEPVDSGEVFLLQGAAWSPLVVPPRRPDDLPADVFAPAAVEPGGPPEPAP